MKYFAPFADKKPSGAIAGKCSLLQVNPPKNAADTVQPAAAANEI